MRHKKRYGFNFQSIMNLMLLIFTKKKQKKAENFAQSLVYKILLLLFYSIIINYNISFCITCKSGNTAYNREWEFLNGTWDSSPRSFFHSFFVFFLFWYWIYFHTVSVCLALYLFAFSFNFIHESFKKDFVIFYATCR